MTLRAVRGWPAPVSAKKAMHQPRRAGETRIIDDQRELLRMNVMLGETSIIDDQRKLLRMNIMLGDAGFTRPTWLGFKLSSINARLNACPSHDRCATTDETRTSHQNPKLHEKGAGACNHYSTPSS